MPPEPLWAREPRSDSPAALAAHHVSVRFGGVQALLDVSLEVQARQVTGLIGPNGAGKTTLFDVMTGLRHPDSGQVVLDGQDVTGLGPHRRARLGVGRTFQRLELFWSLSVADNVRVGAESRVQWWSWDSVRRSVRRYGTNRAGDTGSLESGTAAVNTLLERVGLIGLGDARADALSTGSARRVELARALAIGPSVLLLDEPCSGLDDAESSALGDLLTDLARDGMAVLLVEHDMDLLMRVCDSVTVIDSGTVIGRGTATEVRDDPAVQAAYLGVAATTARAGGDGR
jgi:branched-chain amino acid transport system ATP-binding protein